MIYGLFIYNLLHLIPCIAIISHMVKKKYNFGVKSHNFGINDHIPDKRPETKILRYITNGFFSILDEFIIVSNVNYLFKV